MSSLKFDTDWSTQLSENHELRNRPREKTRRENVSNRQLSRTSPYFAEI